MLKLFNDINLKLFDLCIGTVVGNSLSGAVIQATGSWASAFYVAGIAGAIWVLLFMLLCYGNPDSHPFISEKEKIFLGEEIGETLKKVVTCGM